MKKIVSCFVLLFPLLIFGWSDNSSENTAVTKADGDQENPLITTDGNGGCYIAWEAEKEIRVSRLAADGSVYKGWPDEGVVVPAKPGLYGLGLISTLSDGDGGVYIRWETYEWRGWSSQYLIRYLPDGTVAPGWGNGKGLEGYKTNSMPIKIIADLDSDKNNGLYAAIVTLYYEATTPLRIAVKHYNERGEEVWGENKLVVDVSYSADTSQLRIATLNNGDVMVCWKNDNSTIYGIRCDSNGDIVSGWPATGKAITEAGVKIKGVRMEGDGSGGVYIAWRDDENKRISVTHIDQNGNTSAGWNIEGQLVSSVNGTASGLEIAVSSDGALYLVWQEMRGTTVYRVYLQRINSDGTLATGWNIGGLVIAPVNVSENQLGPQLAVDDMDGAYVIWSDYRSSQADLYVQRIDKDGQVNSSWSPSGTPFCIANNYQYEQQLISTERGGIIATWSDYRNNVAYDIYAQKICPSSALGFCSNDNILPNPVIQKSCNGCDVPFDITFDGSASTDTDGTIEEYEWIIDTETWNSVSFTKSFTVSPQRFYTTGDVTLWVQDNMGDWAKAVSTYYIFPTDTTYLEFKVHPKLIKARGKGMLYMEGAVITNAVPPLGQWDPFLYDLGLKFSLDNGTLSGDSWFENSTGSYYQEVISGSEGTARLCCNLCGVDEYCLTVTYFWPQPPINLTAEAKLERSLFLVRYYTTVTWEANPGQIHPPLYYNIYRCYDNGDIYLVGVVPAAQYSFSEIYNGLSASRYAVTSVDYDGDESDPAYVDITVVE